MEILSNVPAALTVPLEEGEEGIPETWRRLTLKGKACLSLKNKDLRVERAGIAKCRMRWNKELPLLTNWEKLWKGVWKVKAPPRWNELYYRILHRTCAQGRKQQREDGGNEIPNKLPGV